MIIENDGTILFCVAAAPEKGAANTEIIKWFARKFQKPASQVRLVSGLHSRTKIIEILSVSASDVARVLGLG
jgi:hypothetical protein